jgi:hypothetical protein
MRKHACMARDDLRGRCSHGGGGSKGGVAARRRLQRASSWRVPVQQEGTCWREVPPTEAHDGTAGVRVCLHAGDGMAGQHLPVGRASTQRREQPLRFELRQAEALHELRACAGRGIDEVAHGIRLHPRAEEVGRSTPSTLKHSEHA